ncbi:MAG: PEP-CTERM sorting domain-containing protein [Planctomycetes bacterium]|nr:PEP-CTERM sorting domain-containing protein [Planctomycetota bacterium]
MATADLQTCLSRFLRTAIVLLLVLPLVIIAGDFARGAHTSGDMNGDFVVDQTDLDIVVANIEGLPQEDFRLDGDVDANDLNNFWKPSFGVNANADANGDGQSNGFDALAWQRHFGEIRIIRGDIDSDGLVEVGDDLPLLQADLGQTGPSLPADLDDDGDVDADDEAILLNNVGLFKVPNTSLDVIHDQIFDQGDIDFVADAAGLPSPTPQFYPSADPAIASEVALSLNLVFNTSGDPSSGGVWTVVGKANLAGLAGVSLALSDVEFNDITGFLGPASFEVGESADFGTHQDIVLMDDMEDVVNDVGVSPTAYVDDPALVPLSGEPDLGSFTGGVELATGAFLSGNIPDWFDNGNTSTLSNLFTGGTISLHRTSPVDEVNLATTLLTVRSTNIPEPASAVLLLLAMGVASVCRHRS